MTANALTFIRRYYRSIIIAVIILILTTIPGDSLNSLNISLFFFIDKIAHFIVFFILSIYLFSDLKKGNTNLTVINSFLIVLLINFFYGLGIELFQLFFTESRNAELSDILANVLGTITACLIQIKYKIIRY